MSETGNNFHEFALHTSLFKGRPDWYFSYIKSEKIAQVLFLLARSAGTSAPAMREIAREAGKLPETVVRLAAGEVPQESVLADIFALLSMVRLAAAEEVIGNDNALLIAGEYERIAEKVGVQGKLSPFITTEDFSLPQLPLPRGQAPSKAHSSIKDTPAISYRTDKRQSAPEVNKGQKPATKEVSPLDATKKGERSLRILEAVRSSPGASLKEIAALIKDCGEKTIQRELALLISQGLVRKEGERRWSIYKPVSGI